MIDVGKHGAHAFADQSLRDGAADPLAGAGHDRALARRVERVAQDAHAAHARRRALSTNSGNTIAAGALRPLIRSDALSAIIMVEALRLAEIILGMIDASTTRSASRPCTRS